MFEIDKLKKKLFTSFHLDAYKNSLQFYDQVWISIEPYRINRNLGKAISLRYRVRYKYFAQHLKYLQKYGKRIFNHVKMQNGITYILNFWGCIADRTKINVAALTGRSTSKKQLSVVISVRKAFIFSESYNEWLCKQKWYLYLTRKKVVKYFFYKNSYLH